MNYFEALSNFTNNIHEKEHLEFHVDGCTEPDILEKELKDAYKKIKNGKAPGLDEIPAKLLNPYGAMWSPMAVGADKHAVEWTYTP